ncbi:YbaB/EbfC family nucleoid-associated protein [Paractinoplanes hotanensis]|uniref:YbaB/EbfC family nucleoid-associated protein n=1 Tax=Paractinoplanes hotanensis TaxID=2906497 RepID=A0ABT0XWD8_9ACTN|nr:YbaB/EbfC family nucleoid-associated protein [Actinoplanes hotanensis]MCM4078042.1 YbaB/EbfC family nucleoid-associated protein [Actinoplanes hotanensis]
MNPGLEEFFERAQAFEQQLRDAQGDLTRSLVTGRSADGTVTVLATGMGKLHTVRVDPAIFDRGDVEALQEAIAQAVRAAAESAGRLAEQKMGPVEITLH